MPSLLALPAELLIIVCKNLTIPAIFNLRIVHPHLNSLIINKSTSISGNVAYNTFQDADLLLRTPANQQKDFEWLKSLIFKYNAAVLVDRFRIGSDRVFMEPRWIPAESKFGNALRERVENGWRVIRQIGVALGGAEVILPKPGRKTQTKTGLSLTNRIRQTILLQGKTNFSERERSVYESHIFVNNYLETLSLKAVEDYQITFNLLLLALRTEHDPLPVHLRSLRGKFRNAKAPAEFDFDFATGTFIENQNSWVNWAVLQLSPYEFFLQWLPGSERRPAHVREKILRKWEETENAVQERDLARFVKKTTQLDTTSWMNTVNIECEKYLAWKNGLMRFHSGETLPNEWMENIAFIIDLRENDDPAS